MATAPPVLESTSALVVPLPMTVVVPVNVFEPLRLRVSVPVPL